MAEPLESLADEAYIQYAIGVAIINNPEHTQPVHGLEVEEENHEAILVHAERLMLSGLQDVIRYANPPGLRSPLIAMEARYLQALPHMQATVSRAYDRYADRLTELNIGLPWVRPAPMTKEVIYRAICHSRLSKLQTARLLDSFRPSPLLEAGLVKRTIDHLSAAKAA